MFSVGDRIVHPLHGAGIIRALAEKEIDGNKELYYALELALDSVRIFLPVKTCESNGIRPLCSEEQAKEIISLLPRLPVEKEVTWNKRYRENMLHIRSGNLIEVAQATKNLWCREQEHGLSAGEKKMLQSARKILFSELSLALHCEPKQIEQYLHMSS